MLVLAQGQACNFTGWSDVATDPINESIGSMLFIRGALI